MKGSRLSAASRVSAAPSASEKTTTGSTAPSAAALIGFTGTMSTMRCESDGIAAGTVVAAVPSDSRSRAATSGEMCIPLSAMGASSSARNPDPRRSSVNVSTA